LQIITIWVGATIIERVLGDGSSLSTVDMSGGIVGFLDDLSGSLFDENSLFDSLLYGIGALLLLQVASTALGIVKLYLLLTVNQSVLFDLRQQLFGHLTNIDLSFSRTFRHGEITSLFTNDVERMHIALINSSDRMFMEPIRLIIGVTLMVILSPELTACIFVFLIVGALVVHFVGDRIETIYRTFYEKTASLHGHLTEYLSSVLVARSLGREEFERKKFDTACKGLKKASVQKNLTPTIMPEAINILLLLGGAGLLAIGGYQVFVKETMERHVLLKMALLLPMVYNPMESIASLYTEIRASMATAKRVFTFLDHKPAHPAENRTHKIITFEKNIEFKNVHFGIDDNTILHDVSFEIPRGRITLFYGPSGGGKTTILSLMAGLYERSGGTIEIDGIDLSIVELKSLRKLIAFVPQEPVLLNASVKDNMLYANPDATDDAIIHALKQVSLWTDRCVFYDGLDTPVGNRGELISGGERQRLTVARSLLADPKIILLDEPTSMIDRENRLRMYDTIVEIARERTVVVAAHDERIREYADLMIEVHDGTATSIGSDASS